VFAAMPIATAATSPAKASAALRTILRVLTGSRLAPAG
jgi:hypothetical protein